MTLWDQVSDAGREALVAEFIGALPASDVPHHLRGGLVRYVSDGILPGAFLQAILCNDLTQAVLRADPHSLTALRPLLELLLAHAPVEAWGSRKRVLAWTTTPDRLEV
jgi:hypothetical protein